MRANSDRLTPQQAAKVVAMYGQKTPAQIAKALGLSINQVYALAHRRGLTTPRRQRKGLLEFTRRKHALGWSDAEIAQAWLATHPDDPLDRRYLCAIRREKLGLPHNAYSAHRRARVAAATQAQCRAAGVKSLADVRRLAYNAFAKRQGWPEDLRPRAVQILKLLYEQGPHTRRQIADAIGMPWKGSRKSLVSNDPEGSYLAHLVARKLVIQLPRLVKGQGRGNSVHLYAIAPHVKRGVAS